MGIQQICDAIRNLFNSVRPAADRIPAIILACSLTKRPGLSVIVSAGNVIRAQAEFGAPTAATLPDGTPNMMNALIVAMFREEFRALREDAKTQILIQDHKMNIVSTGSNAGGPLVATGTNVGPVEGDAVTF